MQNLHRIGESRKFTVAALLLVMVIGFFLRFDDLGYWLKNVDQYFFNAGATPVTIGVDPYYYMDIGADLLQGKVEKFDPQRQYPTGSTKPEAAPLLSVLLALFSLLTRQSMEWVAILLPPFLGILLAIPVYLLGYKLTVSAPPPWQGALRPTPVTAKIVGLSAALLALLSPAYIERSSIGWCDTDILNVTFVTIFAYLALLIATGRKSAEPGRVPAIAGLFFLLFIWWWDQILTPPLLLAGIPILLALFFAPTTSRKELARYGAVFIVLLLVLWLWKGNALTQIPQSLIGTFNYVFGKDQTSIFPALETLVQEQRDLSLHQHAVSIAGNAYIYLLSVVGLVVLALIAGKNLLFLLPLLGLNLLALQASRFSIFAAPIFGLGLGALVFLCLSIPAGHRLLKITATIIFLATCSYFPARKAEHLNPPTPTLDPLISEAMAAISTATPKDSVIWTSWGHGHPLVYYSKRKTIADGMYHPTWLQYVIKFPFATANYRLAANWIRFYTVNGETGLKKMFAVLAGDEDNWPAGVTDLAELLGSGLKKSRIILTEKYGRNVNDTENILARLFPENCPPVYLFMDYKLVGEAWYYIGRWDLKIGQGPADYTKIPIFSYLRNNSAITGLSDLGDYTVNLNSGMVRIAEDYFDLTRLSYDSRGAGYSRKYPPRRDLGHTMFLRQNDRKMVQFGALLDNRTADTVFMRLFFDKQFGQGYFSAVLDETPVYLLCKVQGDIYQGRP